MKIDQPMNSASMNQCIALSMSSITAPFAETFGGSHQP